MTTRLAHVVLGISAAVCSTGCTTGEAAPRFRTFQAQLQRVTPTGHVVLASGESLHLAGVRMRSVNETQEPELLGMVNDLIRCDSERVRVQYDTVSDTAVVYYSQQVCYLPDYLLPVTMAKRIIGPTVRGTVNELLIVMAAARYDPTIGAMTEAAACRCELAAEKAELAAWQAYRYRPLGEYPSGVCQLYTRTHAYRARVAKGDVTRRDRNLSEARRMRERLGRVDAPDGSDTTAVPSAHEIAPFVDALTHHNRCVRRYAAHELAKLGTTGAGTPVVQALIDALSDEDRYVRANAARALGGMGDTQATHALEQATRDKVETVRRCAREALRKLRGRL